MAKGKRAVALFEVIQSSKTSRQNVSLSTPKWWFKTRTAAGGDPLAVPTTGIVPVGDPNTTVPAPRVRGIDLRLDPDRQKISFKLSYTSALVAAFAVVTGLGLAIVIGQHMVNGPAKASANATTEQLRQGPPQASVLNVGTASGQSRAQQQSRPQAPRPSTSTAERASTPPPTPASTPPPSQAGNAEFKRVLNQNYIVVQSWPEETKKMAYDACDALNKAGIPCTVETNLPRKISLEYAVVTRQGFARASGSDYEACVAAIKDLSDKFAGKSKFMRFAPSAFKWDGSTR